MTCGNRSTTEHAATTSGTNGVGSTNSIGTNTNWVGAVHALPTGDCTRRAMTYVTTETASAQTENERGDEASTASAPAATTKITAAVASVMSRRRATPPPEWRSRPTSSRLSAPGVSYESISIIKSGPGSRCLHQLRFHGSTNTSSTRTLPSRVVSLSDTWALPSCVAATRAELVSAGRLACQPPTATATPAGIVRSP